MNNCLYLSYILTNYKNRNTMKDICYKCGVVQEYGTMKDINEVSFEILCNSCYNKETIKSEL